MNNCENSGIHIHKAETTFTKPIPFKIYSINNNAVGTREHSHDYMQIWYAMSGCCEHHVNGKSHRLTKGDLFVLPPFVAHRIKVIEKMEIRIIGCEFSAGFINENIPSQDLNTSLFDFAYLEPFLVSSDIVRPRLNLYGKSQVIVEQLLEDMLQEYEKEQKYYEITIKADLLKMLAIIAREYESSSDISSQDIFRQYRDAVSEAIRYIDGHFTERIYMKDICKIAMMSHTYFTYLFRQISGKTFVEYVNSLRVRKAAEMLRNSDNSIQDICFDVGYNDPTYFDRVFKKITGLSPSKYRLVNRG